MVPFDYSFLQGANSELYQQVTSPTYAPRFMESNKYGGQQAYLTPYSEVSPDDVESFYKELSGFGNYNQDNPPELM